MSGVATSVSVRDNMSVAFGNMATAINICLGAFAELDSATTTGLNPASIRQAQEALAGAEVAAGQLGDALGGADNKQKQFNQSIAQGSSFADGLTRKIIGFVGAYASFQGVKKMVSTADSITSITARVDNMNDGLESTEVVMQKIYDSAQRARGSYTGMVDMVASLGNNARDAFSSTDEIIQFAEAIQMSMATSGASAQGASAAMVQLTQGLASGVLRGDELNSVMEQAPGITQAIAKYIQENEQLAAQMAQKVGVSTEEMTSNARKHIRAVASEGMITADIVKNAVLSSAGEIEEQFENMPMTWAQVGQSIANQAVVTFAPVLELISGITKMEEFNVVVGAIVDGFAMIAAVATPVLSALIQGGAWVVENWALISPILAGIATALLIYVGVMTIHNTVQAISNGLKVLSIISSVAHGTAITAEMLATTGMTESQLALNAALLHNPIMWVVAIIAIIIVAIYNWVKAVGGIKIAWATVVDKVLYGWDMLKLGFVMGVHAIQNYVDESIFKFNLMKFAFGAIIGNIKVLVLTGLQNMINGAIGLINDFIGMLNKIPGVSIDAVSYTATFATDAASEEAERQAKEYAELQQQYAEMNANKAARAASESAMYEAAKGAHATRQEEIAQMQAEAMAEANAGENDETKAALDRIGDNTEATNGNASTIANSLDVSEENMAWMRDIAERDIIDRTVFRDIKVDMGGINNTVTNMADLDGIPQYLKAVMEEEMASSAEGV